MKSEVEHIRAGKDGNNVQEWEKYLVVQSNPLIEAQYRLDVLPQKILRLLISKIKPDNEKLKKEYIPLYPADFAELVGRGYDGSVYKDIIRSSEILLKSPITIKSKVDNTITRTHWLASYKHHVNEGWFNFEFSSQLEPHLLMLREEFTQYYLGNVMKLRSAYSIRLYELLKQYLKIGKRTFILEELKEAIGIEKNEYMHFGKFKQAVLNVAYMEINSMTDLAYEWQVVKRIRKVVGIKFYSIHKSDRVPQWIINALPTKLQKSKELLKVLGDWIMMEGDQYVYNKIIYTKSHDHKNFKGYLIRSLKDDYGKDFDRDQADFLNDDNNTEKTEF